MIADFERNQLENGQMLSTDERLQEENKLLNSIVEEFLSEIQNELVINKDMCDLTDNGLFKFELQKIKENSRNVIINNLKSGFSYDETKSYEINLEDFSNFVTNQIVMCFTDSSRYLANRCIMPTKEKVNLSVLKAAKTWFLRPEECKELLEKGYWRYK